MHGYAIEFILGRQTLQVLADLSKNKPVKYIDQKRSSLPQNARQNTWIQFEALSRAESLRFNFYASTNELLQKVPLPQTPKILEILQFVVLVRRYLISSSNQTNSINKQQKYTVDTED